MAVTSDPTTWPPPNYVNPHTRVPLILGVNDTTTTLMVIFIASRLYGRSILKNGLGTDDYIMAIAAVVALSMGIQCAITTRYGNGHHLYDVKPEWVIPYGQLTLAVNSMFPTAVSLTKISLCLTYLRLFPSQTNRWFCYAVITYLTLWCIAITLTNVLQCIPVASYYDPSITHKRCINWKASLVSTAALNSTSDLVVYLWPALYVWNIQLPWRQRVGLIFVFCAGVVVCAAGLLRLYWCTLYFKAWDIFWVSSVIWTLNSVEVNVGIICGCLSGIRPLLAHFFPRFFSTTNSNHTGASSARNPHSQSFPFQSLSGGARSGPRRLSSEEDLETRNYAWASTGKPKDEVDLHNGEGIEVITAVDVESWSSKGGGRRNTDVSSEELIIGGGN
ncbi:hypothetical protein K432DRAFT_339882 [Lepidopterella palustris CBS 459.81]|uniref:Rhodopsin domain-containing protein n=1 Tax=Lepidopterella palustris CBS 459.81 TaxID=1314670 RepID=A0A8E2DY36_9PEZI|nr:hypothetical protein K432DRAFT_339882 [Lepidopterella palustris CBS 459.81]